MAFASASELVIAARAAGYHELLEMKSERNKMRSIVQLSCPDCNKNRVIRFKKIKRVRGPKVIDRCYGCGYSEKVLKAA